MEERIEIYGSSIKLPLIEDESAAINYGLPKKEQKWKRKPLPDYFDTVEVSKNKDVLLTPIQQKYASNEIKRCKEGVHIWIGGTSRYLTKRYYFYLQYYTLEDGNAPDFREADRLYYLFFEYWFLVLWCLGIIRTKKRRQGASSQSCSNILYEAIFFKNSNCGLISKTEEDSKETFTQMITSAYRQLPIFLKPKQVNKEDSVTELVFAHKSEASKGGIVATIRNDEGHNSKISYKAPVLNAYDRGRLSYGLIDEGGKYPIKTPVSRLLAIISKTLVKGVKRVGWVDLPSTVNELSKGGGAEYKKVWDYANQFKRKPTVNRLVRFFQPAWEAYEGFIDEFGDSVINAPTEEQYEYLVKMWVRYNDDGELVSELSEEDIRLGAKQYILIKRRNGLDGIDLEEEIRMNPCTEDEAFLSVVSDCVFNSLKLSKRRKELDENPIKTIRDVWFYPHFDADGKRTVKWRDITENEKSFHWKFSWLPSDSEANKVKYDGKLRKPANTHDGVITVDSYSNSQGGRKYGSKACGWAGRKGNILDPQNTNKAIGCIYGRPQVKDTLHEQIMLAAEYLGYEVFYEHTADDYEGYFRDRGRQGYLGIYPLSLIDPNKREDADRHKGTPITPFSLTVQLDKGISYVEYHSDQLDWVELIDNMLIFEADDRTSYDMVVAWLILIACLSDSGTQIPRRKQPLIQTFGSPNLAVA